jgi:cysteinyl-tRNA synthetase
MELKLFNTLTRKKEKFKPLKKGHVGMYSCGPTVYWYQHIGNLRYNLFVDSLRRVLEYNGFKVKHVSNITDVGHLTNDSDDGEDKMEMAATKERKKAKDIADFYFNVFAKDLDKLNVLQPATWCKATKHIEEQIDLIKKLEKKGFTYNTIDGVYFDSLKFKKYGELGNLNVKGLKGGKRIAKGEKKNITDFALWKLSDKSKHREQEWDSPWGVGFPGWHIECSAMAMKYLGESFDLHTGGQEHIQVHHTNEIAQSEAVTGKKFVNYWMHVAWLIDEQGGKVSKSKGGLFTVSELEKKGYDPLEFRYMCLLTHYRKPLKFTLENLDAAKTAFERLKRKVVELKEMEHKGKDFSKEYDAKFLKAVNDDLNLPLGVQIVLEMVDDFDFDPKKKIKLLEKFDKVLGLGIKDMKDEKIIIPGDVKKLICAREEARERKMWAEADVLRNRIREKGFLIEDGPDGVRLLRA